MSGYGDEFHWPSGTLVYAAQVISVPEIGQGERNITNHGNGGYEERAPNGLNMAGDFTVAIFATPGNLGLYTDMDAGTERVCYIKYKPFGYIFTGWIKNIKPEDADAQSPDSGKFIVTITPHGKVTPSAL
jgi:hypothetical protein